MEGCVGSKQREVWVSVCERKIYGNLQRKREQEVKKFINQSKEKAYEQFGWKMNYDVSEV